MAVTRVAPGDQLTAPSPPVGSIRELNFRPDIEGLRAVAVIAVLLYHASVPHAAGGFVGVDVFFVISGFLITRTLIKELLRTDRLSFTGFYAARARRILPAAALVLVFVAVASVLLFPPLRVVGIETDVRDAALYLVNWHFVAQQTSYMHVGAAPSPLLNYWSLSVEEQFYVAWPLVLFAAVSAARRLRVSRVAAISVAMAVLAVVSFVLSMRWTTSDESLAYLSSPSRAWEFALGGGGRAGRTAPRSSDSRSGSAPRPAERRRGRTGRDRLVLRRIQQQHALPRSCRARPDSRDRAHHRRGHRRVDGCGYHRGAATDKLGQRHLG